jgi:hypothetical protein
LKKRERGELLIQKTARLFEKFLAPIQQTLVEKTYVAFDQTFQLIACDMPTSHSSEPLTLSVVVNEPHINSCPDIDQNCGLSCASSPSSSSLLARNAFIIRRPIMRSCNATTTTTDNIEYLKYGQDFMFECYGSAGKSVCVYSMPKSPFTACHENVFKAHGEMKQFVGLALHSDSNNGDKSSATPSAFFHWRLYHIDPEMRYETIGENVPVCIIYVMTFIERW